MHGTSRVSSAIKYDCLKLDDSENCIIKATITRCDLSARFFCTDAKLLCEFESDKI